MPIFSKPALPVRLSSLFSEPMLAYRNTNRSFSKAVLSRPNLYEKVVQSSGWWNIHFTVGISCERAAPLAEKNAAARHQLLRSLISLRNEHSIYICVLSLYRSLMFVNMANKAFAWHITHLFISYLIWTLKSDQVSVWEQNGCSERGYQFTWFSEYLCTIQVHMCL
jgi:hypothetical protein